MNFLYFRISSSFFFLYYKCRYNDLINDDSNVHILLPPPKKKKKKRSYYIFGDFEFFCRNVPLRWCFKIKKKSLSKKNGQKHESHFLKTQSLHVYFNFPKEKRSKYIFSISQKEKGMNYIYFSISQRKNALSTLLFSFPKEKRSNYKNCFLLNQTPCGSLTNIPTSEITDFNSH